MLEVRETEPAAQGVKSVKTESALQLSTVSKAKPSTVVSRCRYQKSVKTSKVVATIGYYRKNTEPPSAQISSVSATC